MKRVILDTNIYGRMIQRKEADEMKENVVRKELRATSNEMQIGGKNFRIALLGIYDRLTQRHIMSTTSLIREIADNYFETYRQLGGKESREDIINDFLIVACASIHELDIVVSDDTDTMRGKHALKAYAIVNKLKRHRMPQFIGYGTFGRLLA